MMISEFIVFAIIVYLVYCVIMSIYNKVRK